MKRLTPASLAAGCAAVAAAVAVALIVSGCANNWSRTDKALLTVNAGCHVYDARQTEWAMDQHGQFEEMNGLLGKNPSERTLYGFKAGVIALQYLGLNYAEPKWRAPWLIGTTLGCLAVVAHNHQEGARP